jgi:hypothetical protein
MRRLGSRRTIEWQTYFARRQGVLTTGTLIWSLLHAHPKLSRLCANRLESKKKKTTTYNRRDSQMVTHSSTSRPVQCLCMAERTGCPVLTDLWSYVLTGNLLLYMIICQTVCRETQRYAAQPSDVNTIQYQAMTESHSSQSNIVFSLRMLKRQIHVQNILIFQRFRAAYCLCLVGCVDASDKSRYDE